MKASAAALAAVYFLHALGKIPSVRSVQALLKQQLGHGLRHQVVADALREQRGNSAGTHRERLPSSRPQQIGLLGNTQGTPGESVDQERGETKHTPRPAKAGLAPLADQPNFGDAEPEVLEFLDNVRLKNKTAKIAPSRCANLRRELAEVLRDVGLPAFQHGLRAANARTVDAVNYVRKAAGSYAATITQLRAPATRSGNGQGAHVHYAGEATGAQMTAMARASGRYLEEDP